MVEEYQAADDSCEHTEEDRSYATHFYGVVRRVFFAIVREEELLCLVTDEAPCPCQYNRCQHEAEDNDAAQYVVVFDLIWNGFGRNASLPHHKFRVQQSVSTEVSEFVALGQIVYGVCHSALQSWDFQCVGALAPLYLSWGQICLYYRVYLGRRAALHLPDDTSHPVLGCVVSGTG